MCCHCNHSYITVNINYSSYYYWVILKCLTFFCGSEHITFFFLQNTRGHKTFKEKYLSFTFPECNPILRHHLNPKAALWKSLDELFGLTVWTFLAFLSLLMYYKFHWWVIFRSCHTVLYCMAWKLINLHWSGDIPRVEERFRSGIINMAAHYWI